MSTISPDVSAAIDRLWARHGKPVAPLRTVVRKESRGRAFPLDLWSIKRISPPADRSRRYMGHLHSVASDEDTARENLRQFLRQRGSAARVEDFSMHRLVLRQNEDYGVIDTYMVDP